MTGLVQVADADFDWFLRGTPERRDGLRLPPGGVDDAETLTHIRTVSRRLHACDCRLTWMIVSHGEVVGLCGIKDPPTYAGEVEIGYGIAASRRGRGHATEAVAAIIDTARRDPDIRLVKAETLTTNVASIRVLEKNDFERVGERDDPDDGPLFVWHHET